MNLLKIFSDHKSNNNSANKSDLCWENSSYTKHEIYLSYLVCMQLFSNNLVKIVGINITLIVKHRCCIS